ncbi:hypothetical protein RRG08_010500 [Elysia crispata]|uniref:Uncharacterized protein n=1 Tax=Elysia crispata TaxID=231223 RepID=A0AAE1E340_9GAST|nr:hypothetical protein RRG08_010500 [Elysia crispata]
MFHRFRVGTLHPAYVVVQLAAAHIILTVTFTRVCGPCQLHWIRNCGATWTVRFRSGLSCMRSFRCSWESQQTGLRPFDQCATLLGDLLLPVTAQWSQHLRAKHRTRIAAQGK